MKIDFKAPKYVIPAIAIPFIPLFNFLALDMIPQETSEVSLLESKTEFNTTIPEPDLSATPIDSKFENLKEDYKGYTDFSAIDDEIKENEEDINTDVQESVYTSAEAEELAKLRDSLKTLNSKKNVFGGRNSSTYSSGRSRYKNESSDLERQKSRLAEKKELTPHEQFIKEMRIIDSIANPEKYKLPEPISPNKIAKKEKKVFKVISKQEAVTKTHFNTLSVNSSENVIEGLLDEKLKVYEGSRIRIKLGSDIVLDSLTIPKNSFIFGVVDNFRPQRVEINISNIRLNGKIYDVDLDIYDQDGMKGLYVPSSKFRDFTKQLGSDATQNTSNSGGTDDRSFIIDMVDRLAQTTSKTISKVIKKHKAKLKYNTVVYLRNNDE